jgi:hypothetical protein
MRDPTAPTPVYVANVPFELIKVNCAENKPWQYTYQVAHEFGHLSSRSDKRHPRQDGNAWIEEVICGAYSIYAIRAMSKAEGPMRCYMAANAQKAKSKPGRSTAYQAMIPVKDASLIARCH